MAGSEKVALVTGATSGIGKAVAKGLAKEKFAVTITARNRERGAAAKAEIEAAAPGAKVEVLECDLASQSSVRSAAAAFAKSHKRLDVLVHSAGVFLPKRTVTEDGVETTFATNYVSTFLLTNELVPLLKKSAPSRVVIVSTRYGNTKIDFDDLNFEKRKFSYLKVVPPSKLAQILYGQQLAEQLQGTGVVVNFLHPGLVANTKLLTETGGFFRWLTNRVGGSPEKGADTAVWLATSPEMSTVTGKMWAKRKELKTPGQGSDPAARKRLWEESVRLTTPASKKK